MTDTNDTSPQEFYADFVRKLAKPPEDLLKQLTVSKVNAWHAATGISGEAGELLDAIKRYAVYDKPIDLMNVREELGDLEFYLEMIRQALGISRVETITCNVSKLAERYANLVYSDQACNDRADKR